MGKFLLPFWGTKKDGEPTSAPPQAIPSAEIGDAVSEMMEARLSVFRATLAMRSKYLRAQATATDSISLKRTLEDRADEAEYLLGQFGG